MIIIFIFYYVIDDYEEGLYNGTRYLVCRAAARFFDILFLIGINKGRYNCFISYQDDAGPRLKSPRNYRTVILSLFGLFIYISLDFAALEFHIFRHYNFP